MRTIYILIHTLPTFANKYLALLSGFEYTHFSIAFDNKFDKLYAFQVQNKKTPLIGGLVEESRAIYFHGKKNVYLKELICEIPVTKKEYDEIYHFVMNIKNDKEYTFNYMACLLMYPFGGVKAYKSYYCTEFIVDILKKIRKFDIKKKSHRIRPVELYNELKPFIKQTNEIFSGDYQDDNSIFLSDIKFSVIVKKSFYSIKESICRSILKRKSKNFNYKKINLFKEDCKE